LDKCAIYIRTSTEEQTPELQLRQCREIAGISALVFKDQQSAWKEHIERDAFNELRKAIKARKISNLFVWDLDRVYRNRVNLRDFFVFCKVYGCRIHSIRQRWLEDINNIPEPWNEIVYDLLINIMGWIAEEESSKKSERVKLAITKKGNKTYSKYGKKWGRKQLSTFKKNKIRELSNAGENYRAISKKVGVSLGVVHKILRDISNKKIAIRGSN